MRLVRGLVRPDRLLGMVSPMMVWALYFVCVYSLSGLRCGAAPADRPEIGGGWLLGLQVAASVLALGALAALALRAWRALRDAEGRTVEPPDDTGQRAWFMASVMLALAVIAAVAAVLTALPMLMLETCP